MRRPIWQGPPRKFPRPSLSAFSRLFVGFLLFWRFGGDLTEHKDPREAGAGGGGSRDFETEFESHFDWHAHEHSVPAEGRRPPPSPPPGAATTTTVSAASRQGITFPGCARVALQGGDDFEKRCDDFEKRSTLGSSSSPVPLPVTQGIARTFQKRPDTKREFCWKLRKLLGRYGILH